MEFRILGPLEVTGPRGTIALPAAKPRTLLGVLLLHSNEVVSQDRLIDELWGERMPLSARKTRADLCREAAVGARAGSDRDTTTWLLAASSRRTPWTPYGFGGVSGKPDCLPREARQAPAAGVFAEALSLWRGPALADVSFESFARNEVDRLDEERIVAVMDRVDCELRLGHEYELVPELEAMVNRYPLRERPRAQLMLALYRSGRQADALRLYADTRRMLRDELGLEPSSRLQELEAEILRHDPKARASGRTAGP